MPNATLLAQKAQEIHFVNNLKGNAKMELTNTFSFHIDYSEQNTKCVAKLYQCVKDKEDSDRFYFSVQMIGAFKVEGVTCDDDKRELHIQCYNILFPYAQALASQITTSAGLRGFSLRRSDLNRENIAIRRNTQPPSLPIV